MRVYLATIKDELVLKTVLQCLRALIVFISETGYESKHELAGLVSLVNQTDENEDVFSAILSIKLKSRQKCLQKLCKQIESGSFAGSLKTFEQVIMPMVEFLVFSGDTQLQSRRNTISYDKEQKRATLDSALEVYTAFARQLPWSEYFKLLKRLLYRLQRASLRARSVSTHGEPELEKEKIVTRAICKVLAGFHYGEVPDAVDAVIAKSEDKKGASGAGEQTLFGQSFAEVLQQQLRQKAGEAIPAGEGIREAV